MNFASVETPVGFSLEIPGARRHGVLVVVEIAVGVMDAGVAEHLLIVSAPEQSAGGVADSVLRAPDHVAGASGQSVAAAGSAAVGAVVGAGRAVGAAGDGAAALSAVQSAVRRGGRAAAGHAAHAVVIGGAAAGAAAVGGGRSRTGSPGVGGAAAGDAVPLIGAAGRQGKDGHQRGQQEGIHPFQSVLLLLWSDWTPPRGFRRRGDAPVRDTQGT